MNGFTQDQLATLKVMGFEVGADHLCNRDKGTIATIGGTIYCYHAWGKQREYFIDFEKLVKKIS